MSENKTKKKLDIVSLYYHPVEGGIENIIRNQNKYLISEWDITIHTLQVPGTTESEEFEGTTIKRYKKSILGFLPQINWRKTNLVALHNFNIFPHFWVLIISSILKVLGLKKFSVVLTTHGGLTPDWNLYLGLSRYVKHMYHRFFGVLAINYVVDVLRVVSEWEQISITEFGVDPEKVKLIPNGIEDAAFQDLSGEITPETQKLVSSSQPYLIQVSKIYSNKNQEIVIKALPMLDSALKYVIVGKIKDDVYFSRIKELVSEQHLEDRVIFLQSISVADKYHLLKHAVSMVQISRSEAYGTSIYEGLSQGLPCIVSRNTGPGLLVKNGVNGFVLDPSDVSGLVDKIKQILHTDSVLEISKMKKANIQLVQNNTWRNVSLELNNIYLNCVKSYEN